MRVLALDAALGQCSAALLDGQECLGEHAASDSRAATALLPGMVQSLLRAHGEILDAVAVSTGPGSFTGLRGAIGLAHGLALGAGVPLVGVSVPDVLLALHSARCRAVPPGTEEVWVALDSRRAGRVFLQRGGVLAAIRLESLPRPSGPVSVIGDAAVLVAARLGPGAIAIPPFALTAADAGRLALRRLAAGCAQDDIQPLYVEPPEAHLAAPLRGPPS